MYCKASVYALAILECNLSNALLMIQYMFLCVILL